MSCIVCGKDSEKHHIMEKAYLSEIKRNVSDE